MPSRGTTALAAVLVGAMALSAAHAGAAELTSDEQRLARAQVELDATAAALARARTRAQEAPRAQRSVHTREQRAFLARKKALTWRVQALAARAVETAPAELDLWVVFDSPAGSDPVDPAPPGGDDPGSIADGVQILSDTTDPGLPVGPPVSPESLDAYLAGHTSPLAGLGATFVAEASAVGLDPRLLVAIAGAETSFGTYAPSQAIRNPFGLGPGLRYASWADSIGTAARTLSGSIYLGDGRVTIAAIQQRWAPSAASNDPTGLNLNWTQNVGRYYLELGGDPNGAVFADGAVPLVSTDASVAVPVGSPGERLAAAAVRRLGELAHAADVTGDGISPDAFAREAAEEAGVPLDVGVALLAAGNPVDLGAQAVGDLLLIARPGTPTAHVGIYLGAGAFVHASPERGSVALASLRESRYSSQLLAVRRLAP